MSVLAASAPDAPAEPTTSFVDNLFTISWTVPESNSDEITSYEVKIVTSMTGVYNLEESCNNVETTSCKLDASILLASPYNLDYGDTISVKIAATNG
jgi:hypothetical protein